MRDCTYETMNVRDLHEQTLFQTRPISSSNKPSNIQGENLEATRAVNFTNMSFGALMGQRIRCDRLCSIPDAEGLLVQDNSAGSKMPMTRSKYPRLVHFALLSAETSMPSCQYIGSRVVQPQRLAWMALVM